MIMQIKWDINEIKCNIHFISKYNEKYDSYYCNICDKWLEKICKCKPYDNCPYKNTIPSRPIKPSISLTR